MLLKVGKGLGMQIHSTCHLHHVYVGLVDMSYRRDVFVSHNDMVSPGLRILGSHKHETRWMDPPMKP